MVANYRAPIKFSDIFASFTVYRAVWNGCYYCDSIHDILPANSNLEWKIETEHWRQQQLSDWLNCKWSEKFMEATDVNCRFPMEEALNAYNITLLLHWAKRGKNIFEFTSMEGAAAKSSRRVVLDGIIQSNSNHLSGQVKFSWIRSQKQTLQ